VTNAVAAGINRCRNLAALPQSPGEGVFISVDRNETMFFDQKDFVRQVRADAKAIIEHATALLDDDDDED